MCVDSNSAVRCVDDGDTAWPAPNANASGLHIELTGYARQSRAQWLDAFSMATLKNAAEVAAAWVKTYNISIRHLTPAQVRAGQKGFCAHCDVTRAYPGTGSTPTPARTSRGTDSSPSQRPMWTASRPSPPPDRAPSSTRKASRTCRAPMSSVAGLPRRARLRRRRRRPVWAWLDGRREEVPGQGRPARDRQRRQGHLGEGQREEVRTEEVGPAGAGRRARGGPVTGWVVALVYAAGYIVTVRLTVTAFLSDDAYDADDWFQRVRTEAVALMIAFLWPLVLLGALLTGGLPKFDRSAHRVRRLGGRAPISRLTPRSWPSTSSATVPCRRRRGRSVPLRRRSSGVGVGCVVLR